MLGKHSATELHLNSDFFFELPIFPKISMLNVLYFTLERKLREMNVYYVQIFKTFRQF